MMNPLFVVVVVGALVSLASSLAGLGSCKSGAGIESSCKGAAGGAQSSVDYDFCVGSLKHVRNAESLDLQGLASAAARLALANAESAEAKVDDLMDLELDDPAARDKYRDCLDAYEDASDQLKDALDAINAKLYNKASRLLSSVPDAYGRCGKAFKGTPKLPVGDLDADYAKLAGIALAILSMID